MPKYVISVKTFTDRHAHMECQSQAFGFDFEYVFEYDADCLGDMGGRKVSKTLTPESVSNVLKHLEAVRKTTVGNSECVLVLEDDVVLFDRFFERLKDVLTMARDLPPGWLIFLGGADNRITSEVASSESFKLVQHPITTAEAYLIDKRGCILREEWMQEHEINCQADHQLKKMDRQLGIRHYWVSEPLATQGSITGKFKTALDKSRAKRSRLFLRLKYEFNRIRRQLFPRVIARIGNKLRLWLWLGND